MLAIIGFTFVACSGKNGGGSASVSKVKANPESDFEAKAIDGGKGVEITKYVGDKWEVGIPSKIRNLPVISIGDKAFQKKSLIKVTIPNSVTTIGNDAFAENQLTSITILNSVTAIGGHAFVDNQLTSVTIPNSVTTIGSFAFSDNQLTSITIPDNVTKIGSLAFFKNQLTSITIGTNVLVMADAFNYIYTDDFNYKSKSIGFIESYENAGKVAGTYTRSNTESTTWTKQ